MPTTHFRAQDAPRTDAPPRRRAARAASTTAGCRSLLGYNLAQAAIPSLKIFAKRIGEPFQLRRLDFTILMLVAANPASRSARCRSRSTSRRRA